MTYEAIIDEIRSHVGHEANEPAFTLIGRAIRGETVDREELARDLEKTEGCEYLATELRKAA
jgi:hypothetical protein